MCSNAVVVIGVGIQNPAQMRLAQDDDVVQTFAPNRSDPVSYTHLDVYKRQIVRSSDSGRVNAKRPRETPRQAR